MSRKSKLNPNTRSIGVRFDLQCSVRNSGGMASSNKNCYSRWIFIIAAIVIYLQYQYNTSYYSGQITEQFRKKHLLNTKATKTPKSKTPKSKTFPMSYQYQRIMSYERFKSMHLALKNVDNSELPRYHANTPTCFLNKSNLGPIQVDKSYISPRRVEKLKLGVSSGGFYAPPHCQPRHRVAIFIPFRNRTTNLSKFLRHMHPFLQKQLLQYRIFVIEQYDNYKFNKGALYNIAYLESQRFGTWDCLVFHDVDLLPMDERILYSCHRKPAHMCPALECWGYQTPYTECFGGVTSMPTWIFLKINGYSNEYWNWGAEDDDMFIRYHTLEKAKERFKTEGLKSLQYKLIAIFKRKLFTHILVNVNPFNYFV